MLHNLFITFEDNTTAHIKATRHTNLNGKGLFHEVLEEERNIYYVYDTSPATLYLRNVFTGESTAIPFKNVRKAR